MAATSPEKTKQILDLHAQGMARNAIARQVGVGAATVTKIVHKAGLDFDRTATVHATKAQQADTRARRAAVSAKLLAKADQLIDQIDQPHLVFNIGGKDNVYTEHLLNKAPTGDIRNLMQAAATALGRHMDLERHDADQGAEYAKSMLSELGRAFGIRAGDDT